MEDMSQERRAEIVDHRTQIRPSSFDLVLTNPPFEALPDSSQNTDEERILRQLLDVSESSSSVRCI